MSAILIAVLALAALAALFGAILGFASIRFKVEADPIVDQIDNICFAAPVFYHLTRYFFSAQ